MKKKLGVILGVALVAVMLVAILAGCVPSDPDKAVQNLKANDYLAGNISVAELPFGDLDENKVSSIVKGWKVLTTETVTLIYFKETSSAKEFYDKIKDNYKDNDKIECGRNGSVVYYGTPDAVKAAK